MMHIEHILQMAILLETSISVDRSTTNYLFAYFIKFGLVVTVVLSI